MTFAFISLLSQSCSCVAVPALGSFPVTIAHTFALSSKVYIVNFELLKFDPSSLPDSWRYDSKLLFILTYTRYNLCFAKKKIVPSMCHHRASPICYHQTDLKLQCATTGQYASTGQVRSATTEQIRNFNAPPPGKSDLLPPSRSGTSTCHHRATPICFH